MQYLPTRQDAKIILPSRRIMLFGFERPRNTLRVAQYRDEFGLVRVDDQYTDVILAQFCVCSLHQVPEALGHGRDIRLAFFGRKEMGRRSFQGFYVGERFIALGQLSLDSRIVVLRPDSRSI